MCLSFLHTTDSASVVVEREKRRRKAVFSFSSQYIVIPVSHLEQKLSSIMSKAKGKQTVVETPVVEPVEQEVETVQNGCFIYPDGSKYEGEWTLVDGNQVRNGKGTFTCGPDQYSGNWSNDAMDGEGEYFFSSGAIYRGNFTLNLFHGLGEYVFPDGATYRYVCTFCLFSLIV